MLDKCSPSILLVFSLLVTYFAMNALSTYSSGIYALMPLFLRACPSIKIYIRDGLACNKRTLNLNDIAINFGLNNVGMLLFFHAFTGCDYSPSFFEVSKTQFFNEMVKNIRFYSKVFIEWSEKPDVVTLDHLSIVRKFVIASYGDHFDSLEQVRMGLV